MDLCCGNCIEFDPAHNCCECSSVTQGEAEYRTADMRACDFWEGNCDVCFFAGEALFRRYCADCDWEDDEIFE